MTVDHWTLLDCDEKIYWSDFQISRGDGPSGVGACSVRLQTLRGGLQDGVDLLEVDNGRFGFTLVPTRGLGIRNAWFRDEAGAVTSLGWRSPVRGPVHPRFVPLMEPGGLGWLDGFDELLVRCGLESNGPPIFDDQGRLEHPLHGRIANRPAHKLEVYFDSERRELKIVGVVEEIRFLFQKLQLKTTILMHLDEPGLRIRDEVTNLSTVPAEMQLLYHVNFGEPLLGAGAEVVVPAEQIVPSTARAAEGIDTWNLYPAGTPGFAEQVYFFKLVADAHHRTRALLKNAPGTLGVSLSFDVRQLPCFIVWKNTQSAEDGYVTGLEPATNFPNPRPFEKQQGRVLMLEPGETREFELNLQTHSGPQDVSAVAQEILKLQGNRTPSIYRQPQSGWCASAGPQ